MQSGREKTRAREPTPSTQCDCLVKLYCPIGRALLQHENNLSMFRIFSLAFIIVTSMRGMRDPVGGCVPSFFSSLTQQSLVFRENAPLFGIRSMVSNCGMLAIQSSVVVLLARLADGIGAVCLPPCVLWKCCFLSCLHAPTETVRQGT